MGVVARNENNFTVHLKERLFVGVGVTASWKVADVEYVLDVTVCQKVYVKPFGVYNLRFYEIGEVGQFVFYEINSTIQIYNMQEVVAEIEEKGQELGNSTPTTGYGQ